MLALVTLLVVGGIIAGVVIYTNLSSGPNENVTVKKQEKQEADQNVFAEPQTCKYRKSSHKLDIFITFNKNSWKNLK